MTISLSAVALAAAGLATAAGAAGPERLTDSAYLAAARCAGLAEGSRLDVARLDARLRDEEAGRLADILDRADALRQSARAKARRASGYDRQSIDAELSGACQSYLKG